MRETVTASLSAASSAGIAMDRNVRFVNRNVGKIAFHQKNPGCRSIIMDE
jgi:hypothetical protein